VISTVIFDFDGLILDTEVPVYQSWSRVYADHGAELDLGTWQAIIGTDGFDPAVALEEMLGRRLDWGAIDDGRRRHRDELQSLESVRPGVLDWLASAENQGLNVGIASSSPRDWVTGHLRRLSLEERFGCIYCRDDVGVGVAKPDPAAYLAGLAWFGVLASEAIAVEDSPHGVTAAKRAGMWCVAVPNSLTSGLDFSGADLLLPSLAASSLAAVIGRFDCFD
jgi:HAD superfamily hydrolase (TIGR01509 family)